MRIGFYTPTYPGITGEGGIGTYTRDLARGLCDLGHEVHVLTAGTPADSVHDGPVHIHFVQTGHLPLLDRLFPGAGSCLRVGKALLDLVRRYALDIVEIPNWEGLGIYFQMRARVPTVVRLSTSSREAQLIDGAAPTRVARWDVKRERWQARLATTLVTHSKAHRQLMVQEIGVAAGRIAVSPLGVRVDRSFRRSAATSAGKTVVYLGRLETRKGTLDLLHAIPQVLRDHPDARFVLIGGDRPHCPGGRTHAQFFREEFAPAVRERVTFAGFLDTAAVDRWLQSADVFVAPSHYESFGLIFPEAMRWGTPVIGTTVGGIPETVDDGRTGLLVPPARPDELARAVARLLADPELRRRLGEAGRQHVENALTLSRAAGRAAALYEQTLAKSLSRRGAPCRLPA